jgi:hypothetical protein
VGVGVMRAIQESREDFTSKVGGLFFLCIKYGGAEAKAEAGASAAWSFGRFEPVRQ